VTPGGRHAIRGAALGLVCLLAACGASPFGAAPAETATRAQPAESALPPMKVFSGANAQAPTRSNADIAQDFLDLHFRLESGKTLDTFTRFREPITVKVTGEIPPQLEPDLARLLARLRVEAGIDISEIDHGPANITVIALSRDDITRTLPGAACFVVPNVTSLADYRRLRNSNRITWSGLKVRERIGVFVPNDAPPQEVRDCLHEELAQALGPLNDLYRLPDSIFNDDNVHTVLTGFDMLILQATYAPELWNGMTQDEVAARLPGILSRLNPAGDRRRARGVQPTPPEWVDDVQVTLGPDASPAEREAAAQRAARLAQELGWTDHRRAFTYYMLGRMTQLRDPDLAQRHYRAALGYLDGTPDTGLHRAFITTQMAAYAVARGDGAGALRLIRPQLAVAEKGQNAALLATLMLLEAEAYDLQGQTDKARQTRHDSLGWARYGFGSDAEVRAKLVEIAALNPVRRQQIRDRNQVMASLAMPDLGGATAPAVTRVVSNPARLAYVHPRTAVSPR
tara:strand:+ start:4168 stop:5703 length:1536 start_codon:yes stop_codon:yes gene_type:complete